MPAKKAAKGKASDGRTIYVKLSPTAWANLQAIQGAIGNLSITATIELSLHTTAERFRRPPT